MNVKTNNYMRIINEINEINSEVVEMLLWCSEREGGNENS